MLRRGRDQEEQVAVLLPEPLRVMVASMLAEDGEVAAVRLVRKRTGLNLLPAVRAVRALQHPDQQ